MSPTKVFALSKLFHERARLGIMTVLVSRHDEVEFSELLKLLSLTKGNLAVHIARLEEAGYVVVKKEFVGKITRTSYKVTPLGRRDFAAYLALLEDIITQAKVTEDGPAEIEGEVSQ
jgi:DNA-binding MarR family transcriptional regulator